MNKLKLIYSLVLILACFLNQADAQNVQVIARLDPATIKIGDQTKLNLTVHQPANQRVNFPQIADSIGAKITVLSGSKTDTTYDQSRVNMTVHKSYVITAFDEGTYTVPPFEFGSGGGVLKSNEQVLTVQTVKVDTTKAIYDIKQPMAVSYTLWDWLRDHWVAVVITLGVLLLIGGIIWYLKTRPKKEVVVKEVRPDVPLHTQILDKLQALRVQKLYQNDVKAYYSELSDIIQEYLEKRYVISTQEKTTDEIFISLKHLDIADENRNLLRQILLLADLVKFAKEKPLPFENEQSMDNAIAFVTKTRQIVTAPKPAEGGGTDAHV